MKLVILGIDGLEYNFVARYRLSNIMQKKYGKIDLSEFDVIVTPPIWASFLTGYVCKELNDIFKKRVSDKSILRKIMQRVLNNLPTSLKGIVYKFGPRILKNPMDLTLSYLSKNNIKTILDEFRSWYLTIPGYNETHDKYASTLLRKGIDELIKNNRFGKYSIEYEKYISKIHFERKKKFLKSLKHDYDTYDIWFFYTDYLDALPHLFISDKIRMMKYYFEIDQLVSEVHKRVSEDTIIFVVSDHGMKKVGRLGDHSDYGFWSVSADITIGENPKPSDFHRIWKNLLRGGL